MSIIKTPEFFINQKSIPDEKSSEYRAFFLEELKKITYGVTINGVFIHGWLYYHLNHWSINRDILDPVNGDIIRKFGRPDLRDNEWIIAEHLKMAEDQKKGLMVFGSRRLGKSVFESSWIGRGATIYEGSENVISSTNSSDLNIITSLIDKGLNNLHPFFKHGRINDNWNKEVSLGFKDKKGNRYEWSKIAIRNLDEGRNTEAFAGLTPKTLIIDEIGKANFAEAFESAKPAFTSPYGWRCIPILSGTGGTLAQGSDAERYFTNPDNHNFLSLEIPNKIKRYGLFLPGTNRMEGKVEYSLPKFVNDRYNIEVPEDSELHKIKFLNTDLSLAKKVIQEELDKALKDKDPKAYLKQRMYFPEDPDDCFLTDDGNDFPIEELREHLQYLELDTIKKEYVVMEKSASGKIIAKSAPLGLKPVNDFPVNKETIKDAPIIIYEEPINDKPPYGLYIAGCDPYNQSSSVNSESLGTLYVYKRMYDAAGGTFQDMIVASYAARPATMKSWHEQVEMLLEYYNAVCMPENEGGTFIQYFDQKNKSYLLADGYSFLKQISPKTSIAGRVKGLPATTAVKNFYFNLIKEYLREDIQIGTNDITGEPITKIGLTRIFDPLLIRELIGYRKTDGNYDRIVAFGHALACNVYFNKIAPIVKLQKEEDKKENEKFYIKSPFLMNNMNGLNFKRKVF